MSVAETMNPEGGDAIVHLKAPVDPHSLEWRQLRRDPFWQQIPAWREVDDATFLDHQWQERNAITSPRKLVAAVRELVSASFVADLEAGFARAPMAVRVSPYLLSLIDWMRPYEDPLRRQFLPVGSQLEADHPMLTLDSLHEQADAPVPGLTHRYQDKALFLALDTCPVYCRFCTRSYAVGLDTERVEKVKIRANEERWARAFAYLRERPEIEDVVVSGGDAYRLKPEQIREIGHALLDIPHVRRLRFATKGPAILPMKLLSDAAWLDALTEVHTRARTTHREVCVHTHFGHPNEITGISQDALGKLFERGITVRNQCVLQRGVNDDAETMIAFGRRLSYINVHPYYVYVHDLVRGTEDMRTTVAKAVQVEKRLRGATAGFNTPTFVVDALGGGGKRDVHSYQHYDATTGVSVYSAPAVKPGQLFMYFDPLRSLEPAVREAWQDTRQRQWMIDRALAEARRNTV